MEPYEQRAQEVAKALGIEVIAAFQGNQCPEWGRSKDRRFRSDCKECGTTHGDKYRVTIKRLATTGGRNPSRPSVSFDFWASWASCNVEVTAAMTGAGSNSYAALKKAGLPWKSGGYALGEIIHRSHRPTMYDILACVASDVTMSTDPDEIAQEFGGEMLPSQAIAIANHARKLQAFFSEKDREALATIDG